MAIGHFFTVIGPMLKSMSMRSSRGCLNGGCLKTSTCSTAYPVSVWVVWIIAPGRKLTSKVKAISRRDHTRVVLRRLSHCWNELVLVANCSSVDWRVECGGFNFTRKEESCLNIYIYIYFYSTLVSTNFSSHFYSEKSYASNASCGRSTDLSLHASQYFSIKEGQLYSDNMLCK